MAFVPDETPSRFVPDEQPAAPKGKPMPANAGAVNLAASVLGIPVDAVANVLNLGIAGAGAATGTTPGLIQSPVGGSEWIKEKLRSTGVPGLSPDNPNPDSAMGKAQFDLAARGGFLPGGFIPALSSMAAEKIGGPQWAGVGAMAPSAVTQAYNAARAPSLARQQQENVVRDATLRDAQDKGYVVPPSSVNPGVVNNAIESFGGKAAVKQQAELKNQGVTNTLVRDELGIPANVPLTPQTLSNLRDNASAPYRDVSAISPMADKLLQRLKDARSEAHINWLSYDRNARPEDLRAAKAADSMAQQLDRVLERIASSAGKPELIQQLRDARTYIAKTYDVERALNIGNGNVDAKVLGRAADREPNRLTGNLSVIGKFAEGPGRQFTREGSQVPNPDVSALNWPAAAALGAGGFASVGPLGLAAAAAPFARGPVRSGLLSDIYQRNFATPSYTPSVMPEGGLQMLLRQAAMQNAQ